MKSTKIYNLGLMLCLMSCKSYFFNYALQDIGVYDDKIDLIQFESKNSSKILIPLNHIGTEKYYYSLKKNIDSLDKKGYHIYYEQLAASSNDTILRKFKKIRGIPYNTNGYTDNIDSLFKGKFKPKKKLISQPSYKDLGLQNSNSSNLDVSIEDLINYYELKYGAILLENCDFETGLLQISNCNDIAMSPEILQDLIVNFRNNYILQYLENDTFPKVAIIYGRDHMEGISEGLTKMGYSKASQ